MDGRKEKEKERKKEKNNVGKLRVENWGLL